MRANAQATVGGPWIVSTDDPETVVDDEGYDVTDAFALSGPQTRATAAYIAGMHPGVALAVADLLDEGAAQIDSAFAPVSFVANTPHLRRALAVARAFLGTSEAGA